MSLPFASVKSLVFVFLFLFATSLIAQDSLSLKNKIHFETVTPTVNTSVSTNAVKQSLQHKFDSSTRLNPPTAKYRRQLDSLNKINPLKAVQQGEANISGASQKATGTITNAENKFDQKLNALSQKANGKLSSQNIPGSRMPDLKVPVLKLPNITPPNLRLENASVPSTSLPNTTLPKLSLPGVSDPLDKAGGVTSEIQKEIGGITNAPQKEINELKNIAPVKNATKDIGQAGQVTKKAKGYVKDAKGIAKGDSASRKQLTEKLESEAKNVKGVKELSTQNQQVDKYKNLAKSGGDTKQLEKEALTAAEQQPGVNHFAGKEKELQGAMNQMTTLKKKYKSLSSLSEVGKKVYNDMHGKPFLERMLAGVNLQVLKHGKEFAMDVNPWLAYRFTGHFTAGAGWNDRLDLHHFHVGHHDRVYGPRSFAEYKISEGVWLHGEAEMMSTLVPPNQVQVIQDHRYRQWVWNSFVGFKRDYQIFKSIRGTVQLLYNVNSLFANHHINIYGDPLTARVGLQRVLKVQKK